MRDREDRGRSGFGAFWSSLPGVLTGIAGVIAAVGTIAALFVGGDDKASPEAATPAATQQEAPAPAATQQAAAPVAGGATCLRRYFAGVPGDRVGTVEAGATDYDVITEDQTKSGPIGLTLTRAARPIGAMRFAFAAESRVFTVESVVDARCRRVATEGTSGGVLQDSGTMRLTLAGGAYDLTTIAWGSAIRIRFVPVVP